VVLVYNSSRVIWAGCCYWMDGIGTITDPVDCKLTLDTMVHYALLHTGLLIRGIVAKAVSFGYTVVVLIK